MSLALVGVAHGFDHAEILDERRRGKIDIGSLRVPSLRRRRIHHVAVEPMHARIGAGGDGGGIHHREGRIDGVVVCKDDARSSKREVVRRDFRSEVVGSKPIPHEDDDSPCSRACLLLLRSQASCHSEQHEGESTQENKQPYFHGSLLGNACEQ